ncbi:DUF868 family protein (DUF868) [Rhynchospora pubera]|uniref:DUF868 family protein (DUF868) n=1 Tax=Rhynchospora pubera TaxID=906938 RepID=A0AAV8DJR0_9POAL|nr:DUF868 family protein (DUF868) [Rhynchospora pubera]
MRDFPSCFGESGVQIADSSPGQSANCTGNAVTCVYQTRLGDSAGDGRGSECRMTVVWSKTVLGQFGLSIVITDSDGIEEASGRTRNKRQLSLLDIKVGPPWLGVFSNSSFDSHSHSDSVTVKSKWKWKRKGSKSLHLSWRGTHHTPAPQLHVFWDLSAAKFGPGPGPEPSEGFYVAIVCDLKMVLLLGDLAEEAYRITGASNPSPRYGAICMAKKQHIYGNKVYTAQVCFCNGGRCHDIAIECDAARSGSKEPCLEIRVDRRRVMQVKRLPWKFRGNQTIVVDGTPIEVLWDVHSWFFGAGGPSAPANAAVFMFHTAADTTDMPETHLGFSLLLYAWKVQ